MVSPNEDEQGAPGAPDNVPKVIVKLIRKASKDAGFRDVLKRNPEEAMRELRLKVTPVERDLANSIKPEQWDELIEQYMAQGKGCLTALLICVASLALAAAGFFA